MFATFAPAMWGIGGAFIYAGPRWVVALRGGALLVLATLDLMICLGIGGIGAAGFAPVAETMLLTFVHVQDHNATCLVIGLFLNPFAPSIVEKGTGALDFGSGLALRVLKAIRETGEK